MSIRQANVQRSFWRHPHWLVWGLALALLGAIYFFTLPLIIKAALAPSAGPERRGWAVSYTPLSGSKEVTTQGLAPAGEKLSTDRGVGMQAYGLWFAPQTGKYAFNLYVRGTGELSVDGQPLLSLEGDLSGQTKLDLAAGPHLLSISLQPIAPKDGSCRVEILGAAQPTRDLLAEGDLRAPRGTSLRRWEGLAALSKNTLLMVVLAYAATVLLILLPLSLAGGWRSLLASGLIILLPALALPGPPGRTPFIGGPQISRLQAEKPDFVVIGNSYADCSIDSELLGKLTGGKVEKLIYTGSETTIHYLMFKNILVASGVHPKTTFIFTSDNSLTNPHLMIFPEAFESLCPQGEDPLVNELVFGNQPLKEYLRKKLESAIRVRGYQEDLRELVPSLAKELTDWTGVFASRAERKKVRKHANQRFGLDRLRARTNLASAVAPDRWNDDYDYDKYLDFDQVVGSSFLPHFISLAHEQHLRLVFIRIQHRPTDQGLPPQDPRLTLYLQKLRAYLEKEGMGFHDFTGDPELTQSMYMADDHLADTEGSTRLFYKRLGWALR